MSTLNIVGSSPPSEWLTVLTFDNNLKETTVPDAPTNFKGWYTHCFHNKKLSFIYFFSQLKPFLIHCWLLGLHLKTKV